MRIFKMMAVALTITGATASLAWAEEVPRQIVVTGQGTVDSAPDMALITLGVEHDAGTAGAAMQAVNAGAAAVLERLAAAGIDDADIQTSALSLNPIWQNYSNAQAAKVTGFTASNMLNVRVRDLDTLGEVLDSVVSDGANRFQGLKFGLQDPGPAQEEARWLAVLDAMARATNYAEAAGVTLGPVVSISEAGAPSHAPMMMDMVRAGAGVPVAAGEVSTTASVTVVYAITE